MQRRAFLRLASSPAAGFALPNFESAIHDTSGTSSLHS
jgi:hypothetical protein